MTINVILKTSDALVLGCDSVASTTRYYLDPFDLPWDMGGIEISEIGNAGDVQPP